MKFTADYKDIFHEVLVIDNISPDDTVSCAIDAAKELYTRTGITIKVLQNNENVSLGGTHKAAFNYALDNKFDFVCILHGDDQGDVSDLVRAIKCGRHHDLDFYLGARFLSESKLVGYSWWRTTGNHIFNFLFSLVVKRKLHDLGSGMNIFRVSALVNQFFMTFPNRLTFNYYFTLYICAHYKRFEYFPHRWSEDDQVSNVKLFRAVKEIVTLLGKYVYYGKQVFVFLPSDTRTYKTKIMYASKVSA